MRGVVDKCCWLCATPSGVCATKHQCDHHKEADLRDAASHRTPYADPTGNKASSRADRALERKKRKGS